jgi:dienelactone hydrolase
MGEHHWEARGRCAVGVTTVEVARADGTPVPVEVWYPAAGVTEQADEYEVIPGLGRSRQAAARDAEPAAGLDAASLVVFSHGMAGHRRQSTFLCTHLASHGAVVAAPDHVGNTLPEMVPLFLPLDEAAIAAAMIRSAGDRPQDVRLVVDHLIAAAPVPVATDRVLLCGHSFGGWTVLEATGRDPRITAVVGLAAGGGRDGGDDVAAAFLDLAWGRPVPTLLIAADGDSILPLAGMEDLAGRIAEAGSPCELVVLAQTDHYHFCDDAEQQHELVRGLQGGAARGMVPFDALTPASETERDIRGRVASFLLG